MSATQTIIQAYALRSLAVVLILVLSVLLLYLTTRLLPDARQRWAGLLENSWIGPIARFIQARLSAEGYLGLQLTIGVAIIALGGWVFTDIAEDVFSNDPIVALDMAVSQALHERATPTLTTLMIIFSYAGSQLVFAGSVALGAYFLWKRQWRELTLVLVAVGIGQLLNSFLKILFARHRPTFQDALITLNSYSFPSGHAMMSMIFYGLLIYFALNYFKAHNVRVLAVVAGVLLILVIGFSRIYLGVHYLSDILAGYTAGLVWLACTITAVETLHRRRQFQQHASSGRRPITDPESKTAASGRP